MIQDFTAPRDRVRVSRLESLRRAYQAFLADETTEVDLTEYEFVGELVNRSGTILRRLTEGDGIDRDGASIVIIFLRKEHMSVLLPEEYRVRLFGVRGNSKEEFVQLVMTVEP